MSAAASAASAVLAHFSTPIDAGSLETLQEEDFLLVHSCTREGTRSLFEDQDQNGGGVVCAYYDPQVRWSIQAEARSLNGLANYHPGLSLSTYALNFFNAADLPFMFESGTGELVYEHPVQEAAAGDLVSISFDVVLKFGDLDPNPPAEPPGYTGSFTAGNTVYPYTPAAFAEVPTQSAAELATAWRTALLTDFLWGFPAFTNDDPVTVQALGSGDTLLTPPVSSGAWSEPVTNGADYIYKSSNSAAISWNTVTLAVRTVTKVRVARNGVTIRDITLASPLTVPAGDGIRIPIGALVLQLTWPFDSTANAPSAANRAAKRFLEYSLARVTRSALTDDSLAITLSDDAFPNPNDFDIITTTASASEWTITGVTAAPDNLTGTSTADPGGWAVELVTVELSSGVVVLRELETFTVAEGDVAILDASPVLDLAAAPD